MILGAIVALACSSCSSDEPAPLPVADTSAAIERGRADAKALSEANFTADRDLHAALLSVKSREWRMRRQGDELGASAYLTAFKEYLQENDSELGHKIF